MHLHHRTSRGAEFGSGLDTWLWRKLLPDLCDDGDAATLVGGGTLDCLHASPDHQIAVVGGGLGKAPFPLHGRRRHWHFYWVRGPLSALRLRLGAEAALTDGAALLREAFVVRPPKRNCVAFIPDMRAARVGAWPRCCDMAGVDYVDPRDHWRGVVVRLATARLVLAGSLLGAIVADTYRVPWIAVTTRGDAGDAFEWRDWCGSIGLDYRPVALSPPTLGEWLRGLGRSGGSFGHGGQMREPGDGFEEPAARRLLAISTLAPALSSDVTLERLIDRMIGQIGTLRQDHRRGAFRPAVAAIGDRPEDVDDELEPKGAAAWM